MLKLTTTLNEHEVTGRMTIGYTKLHRSTTKALFELIKNKELLVVRHLNWVGVIPAEDLEEATIGKVTGLRFKKGNSDNTLTVRIKFKQRRSSWETFQLREITVKDPVRGMYRTYCIYYY